MSKRQRNTFRLNPEQEKQAAKMAATFAWNSCNFLAGTIAPASADAAANDIESIELAFEQFAKLDPEMELIVQVKHMGSRATLYLHRDFEKSYATTRNGFQIKPREGKEAATREELHANPDLCDRYLRIREAMYAQWKKVYGDDGWAFDTTDVVILDTELMPWSIIGKDLIKREFTEYAEVHRYEDTMIEQLGFYSQHSSRNEEAARGLQDRLLTARHGLEQFEQQVDIFGADDQVEFRPFNILKYVRNDGTEKVVMDNNLHNYEIVGDAPFAVVKAGDWESNDSLKLLQNYVQKFNMEGVVIKPAIYPEGPCGVPPYIKVRNPDYLHIIYGHEYRNIIALKS